jgi:hypothetical protein
MAVASMLAGASLFEERHGGRSLFIAMIPNLRSLRPNKTGALTAAYIRMGHARSRPSDRRECKRHQKYQLSHDPLRLSYPATLLCTSILAKPL